jgi:hypothetical protein
VWAHEECVKAQLVNFYYFTDTTVSAGLVDQPCSDPAGISVKDLAAAGIPCV